MKYLLFISIVFQINFVFGQGDLSYLKGEYFLIQDKILVKQITNEEMKMHYQKWSFGQNELSIAIKTSSPDKKSFKTITVDTIVKDGMVTIQSWEEDNAAVYKSNLVLKKVKFLEKNNLLSIIDHDSLIFYKIVYTNKDSLVLNKILGINLLSQNDIQNIFDRIEALQLFEFKSANFTVETKDVSELNESGHLLFHNTELFLSIYGNVYSQKNKWENLANKKEKITFEELALSRANKIKYFYMSEYKIPDNRIETKRGQMFKSLKEGSFILFHFKTNNG